MIEVNVQGSPATTRSDVERIAVRGEVIEFDDSTHRGRVRFEDEDTAVEFLEEFYAQWFPPDEVRVMVDQELSQDFR